MTTAVASSSPSSVFVTSLSSSSSSLFPLSRLSISSHSFHPLSSLSISPSFLALFTRSSKRAASSLSPSFTVKAEKKKVLIVNTNSGGDAVIGFYFAKELLGSGHDVTILTDGEEGSDKMKKPPFNRFSEIVSAGGKTVRGDPADVGKVNLMWCWITMAKIWKPPVADWAKSCGVNQFLFISSAGFTTQQMNLLMLKGYNSLSACSHLNLRRIDFQPETDILILQDIVKANGHVEVEKYISEIFGDWASFRPQYMIGSGNNKDCEEWLFDRVVRGRPVLIPGSGMQLTNFAHVRDLSSMLTLAVENPDAASGKLFNCVSDRAVTLNGMAKLCAQAAGLPIEIIYYDPKAVGIDAKKAFPFRNMHFYSEPRAAKEILGWSGTTNLTVDLKERFDEYVKIGRNKKQIQFEIDDKILAALRVPVAI